MEQAVTEEERQRLKVELDSIDSEIYSQLDDDDIARLVRHKFHTRGRLLFAKKKTLLKCLAAGTADLLWSKLHPEAPSDFAPAAAGADRNIWDEVAVLTGQQAESMSASVEDAVWHLYHDRVKHGYDMKLEKRQGGLLENPTNPTISSLGSRLQWAHREDAVKAAVVGLLKMYANWSGNRYDTDAFVEGVMRLVMIGAPGTGKTAQAARVLHDVLTMLRQDPGCVDQNYQQFAHQLEGMLQLAIKEKLHYRLDMKLCQMTDFEKGHAGSGAPRRIPPDRSLALRLLFAVCRHSEEDTFVAFLEDLLQKPMAHAAMVLAFLEMKHVIQLVRCVLLKDAVHGGPLLMQFTLDEIQHGFEPQEELQVAGSVAMFACDLLSAQSAQLAKSGDFAVFVISGTHMDFKSKPTLTATGRSKSHDVPMKLLRDEQISCMLVDLAARLGVLGLSDAMKDLVPWPGGNVRHLEGLLAALAASKGGYPVSTDFDSSMQQRLIISRDDLHAVFTAQEALPLQEVVPLALKLIFDRHETAYTSLLRWMAYMDGQLFKRVLGLGITQLRVKRTTRIHPSAVWLSEKCEAENPDQDKPAPLTVGLLQSTGVLALQHVKADEYCVVLPPLVLRHWYSEAQAHRWLPHADNCLLDTFGTYLSPEDKEFAAANILLTKMYAMHALLGMTTCTLGNLVPTASQAYADLEFHLPTDHYRLIVLDTWTKPGAFKALVEAFRRGGAWAHRGPGKEPKPDFWLFVQLLNGTILIIQGQVKSHQYGDAVVDYDQVRQEYAKRFGDVDGCMSFFLFDTDAESPKEQEQEQLSDDMAIVARGDQPRYYTLNGALRRHHLWQQANDRPRHKKLKLEHAQPVASQSVPASKN